MAEDIRDPPTPSHALNDTAAVWTGLPALLLRQLLEILDVLQATWAEVRSFLTDTAGDGAAFLAKSLVVMNAVVCDELAALVLVAVSAILSRVFLKFLLVSPCKRRRDVSTSLSERDCVETASWRWPGTPFFFLRGDVEHGLQAVSYTHLTLPTKRIV